MASSSSSSSSKSHALDACCIASAALVVVAMRTRLIESVTRDAALLLLWGRHDPSRAHPHPTLTRTNSEILRLRMNTTETVVEHPVWSDDEPELVGRCIDEFVSFPGEQGGVPAGCRGCRDLMLVRLRRPRRRDVTPGAESITSAETAASSTATSTSSSSTTASASTSTTAVNPTPPTIAKRKRRRRRWAYVCAHEIDDHEVWFMEDVTGIRAVLMSTDGVPLTSRGRWVAGRWMLTTLDSVARRASVHGVGYDHENDDDDDVEDDAGINDDEPGFEDTGPDEVFVPIRPVAAVGAKEDAVVVRPKGMLGRAVSWVSRIAGSSTDILMAADSALEFTERRAAATAGFVGLRHMVPVSMFAALRSGIQTTILANKPPVLPPPNTLALKINIFGRIQIVYPLTTFLGNHTSHLMNCFVMRLVASDDVVTLCGGLARAAKGHGRCVFVVRWDWHGLGGGSDGSMFVGEEPAVVVRECEDVDDGTGGSVEDLGGEEVDEEVVILDARIPEPDMILRGPFSDLLEPRTRSVSPNSDVTRSRPPSPSRSRSRSLSPLRTASTLTPTATTSETATPTTATASTVDTGSISRLARVRFTAARLDEGSVLAVVTLVDEDIPFSDSLRSCEPDTSKPEPVVVVERGRSRRARLARVLSDVVLGTSSTADTAANADNGTVIPQGRGWRTMVTGVVRDVCVTVMGILGLGAASAAGSVTVAAEPGNVASGGGGGGGTGEPSFTRSAAGVSLSGFHGAGMGAGW